MLQCLLVPCAECIMFNTEVVLSKKEKTTFYMIVRKRNNVFTNIDCNLTAIQRTTPVL